MSRYHRLGLGDKHPHSAVALAIAVAAVYGLGRGDVSVTAFAAGGDHERAALELGKSSLGYDAAILVCKASNTIVKFKQLLNGERGTTYEAQAT